ncbi:hypothetical protein Tco_1058078 [Tanacetum coccineum]|uniref:AH domain-containing protein n=1 Tax=Tanacetum coccineum TaxID=301880 RepID=A0ABQ5H762_9ASTR
MRSQLNDSENITKVRTKVTTQNEGTRGFKHIREAFEKDIIPFVKSLKDTFTTFDQGLFKEITEMKEAFNQMETKQILSQDVLCIAMRVDVVNNCVRPVNDNHLAYAEMEQSYIGEYSKVLELEAELSKKKDMVKKVVYNELSNRFYNSHVVALAMYKLDLPPLSLKLKRNREVHVDYLKQAKAHADTLCAIFEQAKDLKPLDNVLDYACKFTTRIQELQIKSAEPSESTRNTPKQADSQNSKNTNQPLLTFIGVKSFTKAEQSTTSL